MKQATDGQAERARETRDKLIEAGLSLFSRHGLEGVRTRQLAEAAGVNQSAIPYHFGGKDGVYAAVVRHVAHSIVERVGLGAASRPPSTAAGAAQALKALMRNFTLVLLEETDGAAGRSLLLAREQLHPTPIYEELYAQLFQPLHTAISGLVAALRSGTAEDPGNVLRAHALLGQAIAFAVAREALLRRLGAPELSGQAASDIADMVGEMSVAAAQAGR